MCSVTLVDSLVGDQPHDSPVFRKHLGPDEDPEHREDLKEKVLEHAGDMLSSENKYQSGMNCTALLDYNN